MKKISYLLCFTLILCSFQTDSSKADAYKTGEFFKFRIHYGLITAGYATLQIKDAEINSKKMHHVVGYGKTTGAARLFFKVEDHYESYIDTETNKPYIYVRNINEGGYTKNQQGYFNQSKNTVLVKDLEKKTENTFNVTEEVQDIVSAFYYLRNHPKVDKMQVNEFIVIDMFFDNEIFKFKLKFLGKEKLDTKFGEINTMKFRPYVQSGRVFKEQESLTVWVSDDANKMPLSIKASLAVGSLKADISEYKGLKYPIKFEN